MKEESRELDDSEKQWRLRYDCLIEEQNLLKSREAAFRNQLSTLHHILSAVSPKRGFNYPTSPRRSSEEGTSASRRSSRPSPPAKIRPNRDSVESVPSQTENSNQSSQDFWVADIRGTVWLPVKVKQSHIIIMIFFANSGTLKPSPKHDAGRTKWIH